MRKHELPEMRLVLDTLRGSGYNLTVLDLRQRIEKLTPCDILGHRILYLKEARIKKYLAMMEQLGVVKVNRTMRPFFYGV